MKKTFAVLGYIVLRLLVFIAPLLILLALGVEQMLAVVIAAFVGLGLSFLFLRRPLGTVSTALYETRHPQHDVTGDDELSEDEALESDPKLRAAQDAADDAARSK